MAVYGTDVYDVGLYGAGGTVGFPLVELLLGGVWTDVTAYVRMEQGIRIQRGRTDWSQSPTYATAELTFDNRDGRFSPRNTSGAYYGNIGRNTQLRVSVYQDDGSTTIRFWGDVSEWPVVWEQSGHEITVAIQACGIRRSLGKLTVGTPYRRARIAADGANLVAYWPMDDGSRATSFASALTNGTAGSMVNVGGVPTGITLASNSTTFLASDPLPVFTDGASASFVVPPYSPDATGQQVRMLYSGTGTGGFIIRVDTVGAHYFLFEHLQNTNSIQWKMFNYNTGVLEYTSSNYTAGSAFPQTATVGSPIQLGLFFKQNGTGVDTQLNMISQHATSGSFATETIPLTTFGYITGITLYMDPINGSTVTVGQLSVQRTATSLYDLAAVLDDYAGDAAVDRFTRLCTEQGVSASIGGALVTTELMGPQPVGAFLDLIDECAYVEDGLSTESVASRSVRWRARSDMYSQDPNASLAFTYGVAQSGLIGIQPVDDDQFLVNDVTVARTDGASARIVDTTSAVSTSAVGTYAVEYDLNLYADSQCAPQAGWRLAEGTVNKPRWPHMTIDARLLSAPNRIKTVALREGDVLSGVSMPAYSGGDTSVMLLTILGWTETIGATSWVFDFNCVDATVRQTVFILDSATWGVLDTDRLGL